VRNVAISYFEGTKIVVDWPPLSVALPAGAGKVVLTLLMLTPDLVRGPAKVAVTASPHSVAVAFTGTNSKLEEDLAAALDGAVLSDNLDPRTAHAVLVAAQASRMGGKISHHETADTIHVNIEWPQ
jgi:hypothetical protein